MSWELKLIALLLIKHYVFDFHWQPRFMWSNKGTYGHVGGIVHSGAHALATVLVLAAAAPLVPALGMANAWLTIWGLALLEFVIHYHVDWAKMNINRVKGWTATTHDQFWQLTGFDQLLHQLTYVLIVFIVARIVA